MKQDSISVQIQKVRDFLVSTGRIKDTKGTSIRLLRLSDNRRRDSLNEMAFREGEIGLNPADLLILVQRRILTYVNKATEMMTLTLKGSVIVEFGIDKVDSNVDNFLDELNSKYFESVLGKIDVPLDCQEKGVIIALLGLFAFSSDSAFKISAYNNQFPNVDSFRACVDSGLEFLTKLGPEYKDDTAENIWSLDVRGEDPVTARLARLSHIPLRTNGIYKKSRENGHYLDLMNGKNLKAENVTFILRKLFDKGVLDAVNREEFIELLKKIQSDKYKVIPGLAKSDSLALSYSLYNIVRTYL